MKKTSKRRHLQCQKDRDIKNVYMQRRLVCEDGRYVKMSRYVKMIGTQSRSLKKKVPSKEGVTRSTCYEKKHYVKMVPCKRKAK